MRVDGGRRPRAMLLCQTPRDVWKIPADLEGAGRASFQCEPVLPMRPPRDTLRPESLGSSQRDGLWTGGRWHFLLFIRKHLISTFHGSVVKTEKKKCVGGNTFNSIHNKRWFQIGTPSQFWPKGFRRTPGSCRCGHGPDRDERLGGARRRGPGTRPARPAGGALTLRNSRAGARRVSRGTGQASASFPA